MIRKAEGKGDFSFTGDVSMCVHIYAYFPLHHTPGNKEAWSKRDSQGRAASQREKDVRC